MTGNTDRPRPVAAELALLLRAKKQAAEAERLLMPRLSALLPKRGLGVPNAARIEGLRENLSANLQAAAQTVRNFDQELRFVNAFLRQNSEQLESAVRQLGRFLAACRGLGNDLRPLGLWLSPTMWAEGVAHPLLAAKSDHADLSAVAPDVILQATRLPEGIKDYLEYIRSSAFPLIDD